MGLWAEVEGGSWKVPHSQEWPIWLQEGEVKEVSLHPDDDLFDSSLPDWASDILVEERLGRRRPVDGARKALAELWGGDKGL
jgi:hypothetical protein